MRPKVTDLNGRRLTLRAADTPPGPGDSQTAQGDRSQEGVALVITLILLSVITFMAVTFLVVTRGQHSSVDILKEQTTARQAAESALEAVKIRLIAPMIAFTNVNFDMIVSTNYQNPLGFINGGPAFSSYTNANYLYPAGTFLTGNDFLQNLQNLLYSPRAPVFVTNKNKGIVDFRFYYDINRNGRYDTNGLQPVINPFGTFYDLQGNFIDSITPGNTLSNSFIGDPEWIGILEKPGYPHSPTNRFIARFAYIVVPTANTLDANYIHNYLKLLAPTTMTDDAFRRNQGVGTWEINLAGLLADLNTNFWPFPRPNNYGSAYFYIPDIVQRSKGSAFFDAMALVRYRYAQNSKSLDPFSTFVNSDNRLTVFESDNIDGYGIAPLMVGNWLQRDDDARMRTASWAGSDNPTHFFTPHDFFDKSKISYANPQPQFTFVDRLSMASTNIDSYNRYTFFRLISTLGTDSAGDPPDRQNINYDNLVQANAVTGTRSATNFIPWRPIDFFTNAALRLLANAGYGTNVIKDGNFNIKIYPTNFYSPSVHRFLQLAANIYDATTNRVTAPDPISRKTMGLPSVFRPIFRTGETREEVFISGYEAVTNTDLAYFNTSPPYRDLSLTNDRLSLVSGDMVYGVPLVIGAKKGIPNFNEFAMQTSMNVTRKLEFRRPNIGADVNETNQMYIVGVSNIFAVEGWNSYTNALRRNMEVVVAADISMVFSNESKVMVNQRFTQATNIPLTLWQGSGVRASFQVPMTNAVTFLRSSTYHQGSQSFVPLARDFERRIGFPVPRWWVSMSVRTRFILVDTRVRQIVDFVNLNSTEQTVDIMDKLKEDGDCGPLNGAPGSQWCTNRVQDSTSVNAATYGILNQIRAGEGIPDIPTDWNSFSLDPSIGSDAQKASDGFRYNMGLPARFYPNATYHKSNVFYAPFLPSRTIHQHTTWQANDPLVHYTIGDLTDLVKTNNLDFTASPLQNIGQLNDRYEPWRETGKKSESQTRYDLSLKDPGVTQSDDWQFPTNKLPNIGWLGRIHRGTPWQTVYLKAADVTPGLWLNWSGNGQIITNWDGKGSTNLDAELTLPIRDRTILDLFTAALNDNASRGQMSVNQTNLAGWSAILAGVVGLTNVVGDAELANDPFLPPTNAPVIIDPAGIYDAFDQRTWPPMVRIANAINKTRANAKLFPKGTFTRMGDILSVPELSIGAAYLDATNYVGTFPNGHWTGVSPFLNIGAPGAVANLASKASKDKVSLQQKQMLNDAAYERIPQQILGLLRLDQNPRFVVYAYGQALKPAEHSVITSGPYFGLCTNYQVTAEVATRAVVRIEGAPDNPHPVVENFNALGPD